MLRPWKIPQDVLEGIYKDDVIMDTVKEVSGMEIGDILKCKHHWEGMEGIQARNDLMDLDERPTKWHDNKDEDNYQYPHFVRFVLDD